MLMLMFVMFSLMICVIVIHTWRPALFCSGLFYYALICYVMLCSDMLYSVRRLILFDVWWWWWVQQEVVTLLVIVLYCMFSWCSSFAVRRSSPPPREKNNKRKDAFAFSWHSSEQQLLSTVFSWNEWNRSCNSLPYIQWWYHAVQTVRYGTVRACGKRDTNK